MILNPDEIPCVMYMKQSDHLDEILNPETIDSGLVVYILLQGETMVGEDELGYGSSIPKGDPVLAL